MSPTEVDEYPLDPETAEGLLAQWLAQREGGAGQTFEELCDEHPHLREELVRLHADWSRVAGVLRKLAGSVSDAEAGATPPSAASAEILARLAARHGAFGRYRLRGELARGGMGAILRVWDEDLRRNLAMKVVLGRADGSSSAGDTPEVDGRTLGRFLEEAQVTGQLDHPGVVPVHELGLDDHGRVYFTMKLVRGRNLAEIIELARKEEEGWSQARVLGIFLKVCEAIAYAHDKRVVHRDLKPANVMVGRFGETYVMDWGLARVLDQVDARDLRLREDGDDAPATISMTTARGSSRHGADDSPLVTMDGDVVGTPAYMSPEQASGRQDEIGPRSDVYSIGAMLYQLLAGRMPYAPERGKASPRTLLGMLLNGPPTPVGELAPDAPGELIAICEKAMSRDPQDRYGTAMEMATDIESFLGNRPIAAQRPGPLHTLTLFARRNRAPVLTAAAALVVLLGLSIAYVVNLRTAFAKERVALHESRQRGDYSASQTLLLEEEALWPAVPDHAPELRAWLDQTGALLSRRAGYQEQLRNGPAEDDVLTRPQLELLLANLEVIAERRAPWTERLALAESLHRLTVDGHAAQWEEVRRDLHGRPEFGGLELEPQLGLVPLRKDPMSDLWEFWHYASGDRPEPLPGGGYEMTGDTGLVLVLLPVTHLEISGVPHDYPPYFLSKYELTQGQWSRTMGENCAKVRPDSTDDVTLAHPVESLSWYQAEQIATRLALTLPRRYESEAAGRAGSSEHYYWGVDQDSLEGHENVLDASYVRLVSEPPQAVAPWDDGYPYHAPVGSFSPNAFGLFDMHGNIAEWCLDGPEGDGEGMRFHRAGGWYLPYHYNTTYYFQNMSPRSLNHMVGVRLARPIM
jgi:serine/threonine protein kinase